MTKLFVGNLSSEVTSPDLRAAFAAYGPVTSAEITMDGANGRSERVGFVEMAWQAHGLAAIQGLDGTDLKGRKMHVGRALPSSDGGTRGNPPRGWDVVTGVRPLQQEKPERHVDGD